MSKALLIHPDLMAQVRAIVPMTSQVTMEAVQVGMATMMGYRIIESYLSVAPQERLESRDRFADFDMSDADWAMPLGLARRVVEYKPAAFLVDLDRYMTVTVPPIGRWSSIAWSTI